MEKDTSNASKCIRAPKPSLFVFDKNLLCRLIITLLFRKCFTKKLQPTFFSYNFMTKKPSAGAKGGYPPNLGNGRMKKCFEPQGTTGYSKPLFGGRKGIFFEAPLRALSRAGALLIAGAAFIRSEEKCEQAGSRRPRRPHRQWS